jgi:GH25 family lysozyme M1 (1,4-beta-N-acetylmuramidase)
VTRLRRSVSIVGSLFIIAGLAAAVTVRTTASAPAALAATTVPRTDVYGQTDVTSWPNVKGAGMTFVGIQAADGATVINNNYSSQVTGALSQGLFVLPYVFADPLKIAGGAQFTTAWKVIDSIAADPYTRGGQYLPIALDMEGDAAVTSDPCYKLDQPKQMVSWITNFIAAAKAKTGVVPIIYTNPNWWQKCTGSTTAFSGDPLWMADYDVSSPAIPSGWTGYTFWQSSNSGSVGGISGPADLDQFQVAPTVTAKVGTSGSTKIETLNTLAGQPVSYTKASALPAGVSLSSTGLLSWTSTTPVGLHTVAVTPVSKATPAVTVVPSAASATIRMHGTIALPTASRSSTAGAPISLKLATSGPDQNAGFAPTLKATGLPAGLSMTSAGAISGWLTKQGTFTVKVTASDGLGASASASFAWTVKAAADAGTAGQISQVGGSGKCLNDPAGNTANGTPVTVWTCTGRSNQRWTTVQDGTLRTGGKCLSTVGNSTASGAKLALTTCNAANGAQHWVASTDGQLINPQSGKCLDVLVASAANGTRPVIEPCANSTSQPNEHWLRPQAAIASGAPGRCAATSGAAAVLATCANVAAQHWQPKPDGTVRSNGKCLAEGGTTSGSVLSIVSCSGAAATKWKLVTTGSIADELVSTASGLCVHLPSTGTRLVIAACASTPAATWHVE